MKPIKTLDVSFEDSKMREDAMLPFKSKALSLRCENLL